MSPSRGGGVGHREKRGRRNRRPQKLGILRLLMSYKRPCTTHKRFSSVAFDTAAIPGMIINLFIQYAAADVFVWRTLVDSYGTVEIYLIFETVNFWTFASTDDYDTMILLLRDWIVVWDCYGINENTSCVLRTIAMIKSRFYVA